MNSLRISVRRAGSVFAALALALSTALPGIAAAAQLTERSVELSSSSASATGVEYTINFTATQDAGAVVVEFCNDSPLLGATCTAPPGFDINTGTSVGGSFTKGTSTASKLVALGTIDVSTEDEISIPVTGVQNPSDDGALYARIVTYTDETDANGYTTADPDVVGTHLDDGGVAMSITPTIAVSGAVLESMLFCVVGGQAPGENCDTTGTTDPVLELGTDTGGVIALDSDDVYEGTIYTQLSTNAVNGAVVSLKSNTLGCGGLSRQGAVDFAAGCGILPANATNGFDITQGQAKFGVKLGTAAGVGTSNGTYQIFGTGGSPYYTNSTFKLNALTDNSAGVTSTYGDPILDTANAPLNNMNMPITFGASAANNTPAGNYQAQLSLIATGKF